MNRGLEEKQQGIAQAAQERAELRDTLSQLKDRLNYARRVDEAVDEAKQRIVDEKRRHPFVFAAAVVGVAATVGVATWGIASAVVKRFS